ncbi:MAG: Rpn family recombination-promoting nuclease/putative transposase [Bryobacterales bacterium]|nr:Rpn family recombination-promoting nuclease/putative transposase [Bryobacterales bacterium]
MSIAELRLPHDPSYKRLVQNPEFARHLLRAQPLEDLDEAEVVEIEEARSNLIHPDLSQRVVDAAWKLTLRDGGLVYLLVECQSTPDPSMPFRILNAVSALYLQLSRNPPGGERYSAKRVPCVKHLTLYSGRPKWNVPEDVSKLVEAGAGGPGPEVPRMKCGVLDLRRWEAAEEGENLAVLLAGLQRCEDPEELRRAAEPLRSWLGNAEHAELGRAFASWITRVRLPEMGVTGAPPSDKLEEMLETQPPTWGDRMCAEGRAEGRQEGRAEERREGLRRERKLLLRLARLRYGGGQLGSLSAMLDRITDTDLPEEIGEWLLICDSGEALMARLRQV